MNRYEGFSSNGTDEFTIYFKDKTLADRKMLTFFRDGRKPLLRESVFPGWSKSDREIISFSHNDTYYRIYKNDKAKTLTLYEAKGALINVKYKFMLNKSQYDLIGSRHFKLIPEKDDVPWTMLTGNKMYWRGDSLIFSCDGVYVSLNHKTGSISEHSIQNSKGAKLNDLLWKDRIFAFASHANWLLLEIKDLATNQTLKSIRMDTKSGFPLKQTSYASTAGEVIENSWGKRVVEMNILSSINKWKPFVAVSEPEPGQYLVTIGTQVYSQSNNYTTLGGYGGLTTADGGIVLKEQRYFQGYLSGSLEIVEGRNMICDYEKVFIRRHYLEGLNRFSDFDQLYDGDMCLTYVDDESEMLLVEKY